ncbi:MAG: methylation-associated defense system helix-turn-helix domain-containing protein MAD1 [Bdellovibrionales bacterium]
MSVQILASHLGEVLLEIERWLSVEEIAKHLGVSKETIYRWAEKSKIPAHKVGRQWKFRASEVDQWVTSGGAEENYK